MKKILSILMCLVLLGCIFAGCTKQEEIKSDIVLITNGATIKDDGYNQSAWEGISAYAEENNMTCRYFQPVLDEDGKITVENVEKYISLAAKNGAQFIVLPGEEFSVSAYELAPAYPEVKFVLLDSMPRSADSNIDMFIENVMCVQFDALQSGFLAGYISVMNNNTELGYFGQTGSKDSANYGAGFVQGAAYAADSLGIPVTVDWAEYDSAMRDFNYDFTIKACYEKIEDQSDETFKVVVEGGIGSGTYTEGSNVTITANPAEKGKVFDHWEFKSNTDGVKDKKVNISSKTEASMNLLVEKCDCTLTAVYKDIEGNYNSVDVMSADGKDVVATYSVGENSQCEVTAPVAEKDMVFDHWDSSVADVLEKADAKTTKVNVSNQDIVLTPVYKTSEVPTFNVTVETGEGGSGDSMGDGSYLPGDLVEIEAAIPEDGYMFSHWENVDSYGLSTGISMANEYYWDTTFEMVDRYAAICESMYDHGVTAIFNGGNDKAESVFTARWNFDYDLNVIAAGANTKDSYTTIVKNYGEAVKDCLADFKGGSVVSANCATDALYATFVSDNDDVKAQFDEVYKELGAGEIKTVQVQGGAGYNFCKYFDENNMSKCLTLNALFIEAEAE